MTAPTQSTSPAPQTVYSRREWLAFGLFWSWNLIFLAFMSLGFAPTLLPETLTAVRTGAIPPAFLLYALILALIPVACVLLGLTVLRRSPGRLLALGYVVEGPLMLLLVIRFFAIRQATSAINLLLLIALLGMGAFLWDLLSPNGRRLSWLRLLGLTLMAIVALYAAAWILFYALPIGGYALTWLRDTLADLPRSFRDFGRFLRSIDPAMLSFIILGLILGVYTATLFVVTPIAIPWLSLRAWWRALSRSIDQHGRAAPVLTVSAVVVICAGSFVWANRQPQKLAFTLLEKPPATEQEVTALLKRSDAIRDGLLNAYLAPFRYISAVGEVQHISTLYEGAFKLSPQRAFAIQSLYESLARPMLYEPVHPPQVLQGAVVDNRALVDEPKEAAQLYQRFFDTPIVQAERPTIVAAVRSTWSAEQAEAAWQAVDDREVLLSSQEVQLSPHGDWADLELHEVYQNQTSQQQEVVYYFNLPESAVITGLWLGSSPDKSKAFNFQVAPRGAAQAVYREQTRIMRDPALVEQIGPRQYRLRAYPVPPLQVNYDQRTRRTQINQAPELHLWLAWREMVQDENWPLPRLAEKRNVYWDAKTQHLLNGIKMDIAPDAWLPPTLAAVEPAPPSAHRLDLPTGQTVVALPASQVQLPALPSPLRLAVVLDRSRSMQVHSSEVVDALQTIRKASNPTPVDVYLTASPYRGEQPAIVPLDQLEPASIVYFGGQNAAELIAQFDTLRSDREYDAVLVLTDGSGYELGASPLDVPVPSIPLWLVHLGSDIPLGYDDQTLEAVQASGGGVTGNVQSALDRLAVMLAKPSGSTASQPVSDLVDGYLWVTLPTEDTGAIIPPGLQVTVHDLNDGFATLAVRRLILAEMQRMRGSLDQLENLDQLHALAVQYGIITPYSSMIVLVNTQQQLLMDQLAQLDDRFNREVEAIGETKPVTPLPLTGVPEPQEWLLLGIAALLLVYLGYTKRRQIIMVK
jgi:putative PEP-CTERM system integral membrane protein